MIRIKKPDQYPQTRIPVLPIRLPAEYQEIEYVESTGTQYINTGYIPKANSIAECKAAITDTRTGTNIWPAVFGAQGLDNSSDGLTFVMGYTPSTKVIHSFAYTIGNTYNMKISAIDGIFIDNQKYGTWKWGGTPNVSVYLFGRHTSQTGFPTNMSGHVRIYDFKIYEDNTLIKEMIPCYRKSDKVIGFYDLISNTFYVNAGTGTFLRGQETRGEYQEVEYIESTGTQYINTGFKPNGNTKYEVNLKNNSVAGVLFGAYNTAWTDGSGLYTNVNGSGGDCVHYAANTSLGNTSIADNIIIIDKGKVIINGIEYLSVATKTFTVNYPLYIFAGNMKGVLEQPTRYRLYSFKISNDETLVRNFVPCYRKSDNIIGLYDLVNNAFYPNAGTGTFLRGEDVLRKDINIRPTFSAKIMRNLLPSINKEGFSAGSKSYAHAKYGEASLLIEGNTTASEVTAESTSTYAMDPSHVYYGRVEVYQEEPLGGIQIYWPIAEPSLVLYQAPRSANEWTMASGVRLANDLFTAEKYPYRLDFDNGQKAGKMWFDGPMIIDLTEAFGVGSEPTKEWCDANIPYFEGIYVMPEEWAPNVDYTSQEIARRYIGETLVYGDPAKKDRLPRDYQKIEYLQSSGTQYINTEIPIASGLSFECEWEKTADSAGLNGSYYFMSSTTKAFCFGLYSGNKLYLGVGSTTNTGTAGSLNTRYVTKGNSTSMTTYQEGLPKVSITGTLAANQLNFYLFAAHRNQGTVETGYYGEYKIYSCRLYESGVLKRELIPCYRKSDNMAGMYDLVNQKFYTNAGSGTFLTGPTVD